MDNKIKTIETNGKLLQQHNIHQCQRINDII